MKWYNLDALHIACAEALNCEYFLTVDKGILRKAKAISGIDILSGSTKRLLVKQPRGENGCYDGKV